MWFLVEALPAGKVKGQLANDPESVSRLKIGDPVEGPVEEVEDWC